MGRIYNAVPITQTSTQKRGGRIDWSKITPQAISQAKREPIEPTKPIKGLEFLRKYFLPELRKQIPPFSETERIAAVVAPYVVPKEELPETVEQLVGGVRQIPTKQERTIEALQTALGIAPFGLAGKIAAKPALTAIARKAPILAKPLTEFLPSGVRKILTAPIGRKEITQIPEIVKPIVKPKIEEKPKAEIRPREILLQEKARKFKITDNFEENLAGIYKNITVATKDLPKNQQLERMARIDKFANNLFDLSKGLKNKFKNDYYAKNEIDNVIETAQKIVKESNPSEKSILFSSLKQDLHYAVGNSSDLNSVYSEKIGNDLWNIFNNASEGVFTPSTKIKGLQLSDFEKPYFEKPISVPEKILQELKTAEQKGKHGGFVKVPEIPPSIKKIEEMGVKIEKPAKKSLLQFIKPYRETGKLDPAAGEITRMGRNAYSEYENASIEGAEKLTKAWKGITMPERQKLVELQEKGLGEELLNKLPQKYQRAIKEGLQGFNKEIKKIAQEEFKIDISKWGFTEENYFHHFFTGDQALVQDGRIVSIGKLNQVLSKAQELINQGIPPANLSIGPKFNQKSVPTTLLNQKGFWSFVNNMAKKMEVSGDDILSEIQGVAAIKPRAKFVGAFMPRKANLEGYLKDPELTYKILWDRIQRKRFLEPFSKKATNLISQIKTPWLRKEMEDYVQNVAGKYIDPLYFAGVNVSKLAQFNTKWQSRLKLGYRPSTAIINRLQPLQTAYPELGNYYFLGEGKRLTKEGKQIINKLGVSGQRPKFTTGEIFAERGAGREPIYKALGAFSKAERENRETVGVGAYLKGIRKMKLNEQDAIQYARDMVDATQFRYDISDLGPVLRHPLGKMSFQFKNFTVNFLYNLKNVLTGQPLGGLEKYPLSSGEKIARATKFLGVNFSLGGLRTIAALGTPVNAGIITYLAIKHPKVFQGALSYLGIDVSKRMGASPYEVIPEDWKDALGPAFSDINRIYKAIKKYEESKNKKDLITILGISPAAFDIYKALSKEEEAAIQPTAAEKVITGLGFKPSRISTIQDVLNYVKYYKTDQKTPIQGLPTQESLQNLRYNLEQKEYDQKKKDVIKRFFETLNFSENQQQELLRKRKERMKAAKEKD